MSRDVPRSRVREEDWASLRAAVPGFSERWERFRQSPYYRPGDTSYHIQELSLHLDARLEAGDETPLLATLDAFESIYAGADDELEGMLRVGLLEDIIHFSEDHGMDLVRLWLRLGPAGREAWDAAYRYTHGGRAWEPSPALSRPHAKKRNKK